MERVVPNAQLTDDTTRHDTPDPAWSGRGLVSWHPCAHRPLAPAAAAAAAAEAHRTKSNPPCIEDEQGNGTNRFSAHALETQGVAGAGRVRGRRMELGEGGGRRAGVDVAAIGRERLISRDTRMGKLGSRQVVPKRVLEA
ncbi:hypothetical protein O9K51_04210 [Purpureocillium lavendulum]|uniref:Uncharacterized protein n=1 Tax=Purpureocillium lavendulum TaxID=1247861 RepID=A0AB34FWM3_9HYPO|nr:hypothetical protein O9K51_04210 [Purpureocillium lavendulum]